MHINVNITVAKPAKVVTSTKTKTIKLLRDKPRTERKKYLKSVRKNFCITTNDQIPTIRSTVITDVPKVREKQQGKGKEKKGRKRVIPLIEGELYTDPEEREENEDDIENRIVENTDDEMLDEKRRLEEELEDERIFQGTRYRYTVPHNSICRLVLSKTYHHM